MASHLERCQYSRHYSLQRDADALSNLLNPTKPAFHLGHFNCGGYEAFIDREGKQALVSLPCLSYKSKDCSVMMSD